MKGPVKAGPGQPGAWRPTAVDGRQVHAAGGPLGRWPRLRSVKLCEAQRARVPFGPDLMGMFSGVKLQCEDLLSVSASSFFGAACVNITAVELSCEIRHARYLRAQIKLV